MLIIINIYKLLNFKTITKGGNNMITYHCNNYRVCFCDTIKFNNKVKKILTLKILKLIKCTIKELECNNVDLNKNNIIELMPKFVIGNKLVVLNIFYNIERRNCCVCSCIQERKSYSRIYN